ncbi:MAG TPA: PspC domain-containing protein [Bacteroidales bacterium]|nr:PspC domain-containing protein [Bacteroidales bacterium]
MNKTVSVNISGLMFVLDEEAFNRLSRYLRDLRSHFAGRQGEADIITDIESRLAELLQSRLNEQKQVIDLTDVDWAVGVLGQPWQMDEEQAGQTMPGAEEPEQEQAPRRLYRDPANAKIGGVAAGLALYFRIDPLVPRILFITLLFLSGFGVLLYVLLWAFVPVIPESLRQADKIDNGSKAYHRAARQLYRDTDNKKLAGVASGLGHYFRIDPLIPRLLFVLLTLASGIGIVAYIVLWLLTPEAQTTAEKLKMKGQPVNVENIERSIQEEVNRIGRRMSEMGVEAGKGLRKAGREAGPVLGSLLKAIARIAGIVVGIVFFIIGLALFTILMVFFAGFEGFTFFEDFEIPLALADVVSLFVTDPGISQLAGVSLGAFLIIPVVMLVYVSIRLIVGTHFHLPGLGNIAGVLWTLSVIGLGYTAYKLGSDFRETAKTELISRELEIGNKLYIKAMGVRAKERGPMLMIDNQRYLLEKSGEDQSLLVMPHLSIQTVAANSTPRLNAEAIAKGEDEDLARERIRRIEFPLEYRNDTLYLPVWFKFDAADGLRSQRINVRLALPDSTLVTFDPALDHFFNHNPRSYWQSREFAGRSLLLTSNGFEKQP